MILLWTLLTACWTPRHTGPNSMVGHLTDADGTPIAGLDIETVEARWVSEPDGRFAVTYKEPSRWLTFERDGVRYQRTYLPSDEGTDVRLALPERAPALVSCEVVPACDATLTWDLDDGFVARVRVRCDRDAPATLAAAPRGRPSSATCRAGTTEPDVALHVGGTEPRWLLTPPPVDLAITVPGAPDTDAPCTVTVDGDPAPRGEDGRYHAQVYGTVVAAAVCDGVPATPRRIDVRVPFALDLDWTATTPRVDLQPYLPWATSLTVFALSGAHAGWDVTLDAAADGAFVLPPLEAGSYVMAAGMDRQRVRSVRPAVQRDPGRLHLSSSPRVVRASDAPEAIGMLFLDAAVPEGQLPIVWYED